MLGCPRSPYSLQLGPRVLMYNLLEIEINFVYILWQITCIVLTNCGNKCFSMFFNSCCSHARVFEKTLVREFSISYSHIEWYLFFGETTWSKWSTSRLSRTKYNNNNNFSYNFLCDLNARISDDITIVKSYDGHNLTPSASKKLFWYSC